MQEFARCLICNNADLTPLKNYQKYYLVKCSSCNFVFTKRIPTNEELVEEYSRAYTRNDYISPITIKRYDEIFNYLNKFRVNNNILDVGAGNGHFLQAAKRHGWKTYGTEFEKRAVEICASKGIVMHQGKLNNANYKPEMFDIITSFEVLEHINNPIEEIKNFNALLRKRGLVYVTTPNFNSISHALLKEKWTVFNYPEHLSYYTPSTLQKLFESVGFKKKLIKTTGIGITRLKDSAGIKTDNNSLFSTEVIRNKTEGKSIGALAKKGINFMLTATKKGDKIKAEFIKNKTI